MIDPKHDLRQNLRLLRQNLSFTRRLEASCQAYLALHSICLNASYILSFASFDFEIDLKNLNEEWAAEKRLCLPRLVDNQLKLYQVTHLDQLIQHRWGMLEPIPSKCQLIEPYLIECALVPGLGFDKQTKHRLGYGKGCYDRLLSSFTFAKTYGIGFKEQEVNDLPYAQHDIPLTQIYLF